MWLDALTLNVDRTARNTNMLMWHKELWLIDHGAALYAHHAGPDWAQPRPRPFPQIKDHVLLPQASELAAADAAGHARLTPAKSFGKSWRSCPMSGYMEAFDTEAPASATRQLRSVSGSAAWRIPKPLFRKL